MKIAGVMQTNKPEGLHETGALEYLRRNCDTVVVLHHSPVPVPFKCDQLISTTGQWNCTANNYTLMWWAKVHSCDWVVRLDDDMIAPKLDFKELAATCDRMRDDFVSVAMYDLWGPKHARVDGVWGQKRWPILNRNWVDIRPPDPDKRLHFGAMGRPLNVSRGCVYHTGCSTPEKRAARVDKYRKEDPKNEFQADYSYMTNETGLVLVPVDSIDLGR